MASQEAVIERNRQIEDGVFAAIADRRRPMKAPQPEAVPPAINFAPLENAAQALTRAAERYKKAAAAARPKMAATRRSRIGQRAADSERAAVHRTGGLPRRAWYRHLLYAPGFYTGLLREDAAWAFAKRSSRRVYAEAEAEVVRIARAIDRETALVAAAAADLERVR